MILIWFWDIESLMEITILSRRNYQLNIIHGSIQVIFKNSLNSYCHALQTSKTVLDSTLIAHFIIELYSQEPTDILTLTRVLAAAYDKSERAVRKLNLTVEELKKICATPIETFINCKDILKFMQFGEARKQVLINLSECQDILYLNAIANAAVTAAVLIV